MQTKAVWVELHAARFMYCLKCCASGIFNLQEFDCSNQLQRRVSHLRASQTNPLSLDILIRAPLTEEDLRALRKLPGVKAAEPFKPTGNGWTRIADVRYDLERIVDPTGRAAA